MMKTDSVIWIVPILFLLVLSFWYGLSAEGSPKIRHVLAIVGSFILVCVNVALWAKAVRSERRLATQNWTINHKREQSTIPSFQSLSNGVYLVDRHWRSADGSLLISVVSSNHLATNTTLIDLGEFFLSSPPVLIEIAVGSKDKPSFRQINPPR